MVPKKMNSMCTVGKVMIHIYFEAVLGEYEEVDDGIDQPQMGTRADKSLGLLTQRFIRLLECSEGGICDLNQVSIGIRNKLRAIS